jgi:hypothetical protein
MSASELEVRVRTILEKEFDTHFFKDYVQIGVKSNGQPKTHQFDLLSPDRKIVGEVKSGKQYDSVRFAECMMDCFYLLKVKNAEHRIFVLTNRWVYEGFIRDSDGLLEGIEVRLIELQ